MVDEVVKFDKDSPGIVNDEVHIRADFKEENIKYKFIIGSSGIWNTIQEFSDDNTCVWRPREEGKYIVMVQGKREDSEKPYDLLAKERYEVGLEEKVRIIKDVEIDKTTAMMGEKVEIKVDTNESVLCRFWILGNNDWELIRNYSINNTLRFTPGKEGKHEILVECKRADSKANFDEFTTVIFDVLPQTKIEITNFKCLSKNLIINEELNFNVDVNIEGKRNLLYKFIKVSEDGKVTNIQDFSSRKVVTYEETIPGKYKMICLVKDILSNKEYDDRALIVYNVKAYNKVKINNFTPNISSPQVADKPVRLKADASGGRELLYRYIINGPMAIDTGYIRRDEYEWIPKKAGEYDISLYVKDQSFEDEYEDIKTIGYTIDRRSEKPAKIVDIIYDSRKFSLVGQPINIKVVAEGEIDMQYSFIVYRDNKEIERIDYGEANWANFTPEEKGNYTVEIRVKNKYSEKEYDSNSYIYVKAKEYIPAKIDYILSTQKDVQVVGDSVELEIVSENTKSVLVRYVTSINGHVVEDTDFIDSKKLVVTPKCAGKYKFEIFAKNVKCEEEFDCKKEVSFYVQEAVPVTDTKVICEKDDIQINDEVTFRVESNGGKDVCYEFYVMEKGNWMKVQEYSKKNYYTFIPFVKGDYRVLVFAKSFYKKVKYEDYGEISFVV
ncbi:MAG: triple tyrosine motif-containing protein [Clostridium sp.]|uniref:triple tyrosine motif-containing protein n=1 Tax=Clostridium sp. DSM 8431 TaxID=1761781 RepID=UPI0008ED311B|nr:triple tyrosine motif-containing protein [Clostridium sp. DSM 8431]MCR4944163.1 triple tyrosine motif-containing protein [Clostridium sp.]SFU36187.1 Y_Y_Y domain-containing protein [Clostridium sp. DSM 8431]